MTVLEVFAALHPFFLYAYAACMAYLIFIIFPVVNHRFTAKERTGFYLCLSGFLLIKLFHVTHYALLSAVVLDIASH